MSLTDMKCRNAKPGPALRKISDGGGLQLWVQPTGARLWRLAYRFAGKQKLLAFGVYPTISLADARQGRDDAKRLLAVGVDPSPAIACLSRSHSAAARSIRSSISSCARC
jgi:Arm domain-containing DNA-binding protein